MSRNDYKTIDWKAPSREWDIRVNLGEDYQRELEYFKALVVKYIETVNVIYFLVSGVELGENQQHTSFQQHHVHCALVTKERVYPKALKDKLSLSNFSDGSPRQYYLKMRPFEYSYKGWYDHHTKSATKVNKVDVSVLLGEDDSQYIAKIERETYVFFQYGTLPNDKKRKLEVGETKREKRQMFSEQRAQDMFEIFLSGDYDDIEMFRRYGPSWPRNKTQFQKLIGLRECPEPPEGKFPDGKNLVIYGPPGTGKSLFVRWKYPKAFYRGADGYQFWDGFRPKEHTHVYYEDMDRAMFNARGLPPGQWKIWLDPNGVYNGNIKFEAPLQNIRHPVIVTSNYHPSSWFEPHINIETDKTALLRRLRVVHIDDLLKEEGIRLKPNLPPNSKIEDCFEPWDYSTPIIPTRYAPSFKPLNPQ